MSEDHHVELKFFGIEIVLKGKSALFLVYPLGAAFIALSVALVLWNQPVTKLSAPLLGR